MPEAGVRNDRTITRKLWKRNIETFVESDIFCGTKKFKRKLKRKLKRCNFIKRISVMTGFFSKRGELHIYLTLKTPYGNNTLRYDIPIEINRL